MPATAPVYWETLVTDYASSPERMAAYYAAGALAHNKAFYAALVAKDSTGESIRAAMDAHCHPGHFAFAAAALLSGLTPEQIAATREDPSDVDEWCWEWLSKIGIEEDIIRRIGWEMDETALVQS